MTDDKSEAEDDAAVIKADKNSVLTIKGDGTLNVNAVNNGIESDGSIVILGGIINIEAGNDGIDADPVYELDDVFGKQASFASGTIKIEGGNITISAGDDAIKAASTLEIGIKNASGPDINITRSNEGLEAAQIHLYSGKGTIRSSDDGINAAYKRFTSTDEADGGYQYADNLYRYVNADGDGLDSNGEIKMNGGNITVFGAEGNDDAAID